MKNPVEQTRIHSLTRHAPSKGTHILYWMQNSIRTRHNPALEHAAFLSNVHCKPLRVAYIFDTLSADGLALPERHGLFLLQGLTDVRKMLNKRKVPFAVLEPGLDPVELIKILSEDAVGVVTDFSYLDRGRKTRELAAEQLEKPLWSVEADVVVPVEEASEKMEHAARTIRPKITKQMNSYLRELNEVKLKHQSDGSVEEWIGKKRERDERVKLMEWTDERDKLSTIGGLDRGATIVKGFPGGEAEAQKILEKFLQEKLPLYANGRNEPAKGLQSELSPYLRAGNISPVDIVIQTKEKKGSKEGEASFLEELVIRRELAVNACYYNRRYADYESIVPAFAKASLELHRGDKRTHIYTYEELEAGLTYDAYWNAAQLEMVVRGKMHGYMRMYWAKQIIGWTKDAQTAMDYAIRLNNRWELDAVDPNSYAGVIWCFGLHDQGWREREVWGKVRYMNEQGLKRKFNMAAYLAMVDRLVQTNGLPPHIDALRKSRKRQGKVQQTLPRPTTKSSTKRKPANETKDPARKESLLRSIKRLKA